MNILKFIESFTNEGLMAATGSRRDSFTQFGNLGKNLAFASIPFGLSALANKAMAQDITATPATPIGALQFALTLEYLENEFYAMALDSGVIPASENGGRDLKVFQQIADHEADHVKFLIAGLGGTMSANFVPKPTFDFTVGGAFDPFGDYPTFLALAQAFEDTGVRAYKGRAPELVQGGDLLTAALRIHSVEARHAAKIRIMRRAYGSGIGDVKPWITGNMSNINSQAVQPSYNGEENTVQLGIQIVGINGLDISADDATEAFDEPLSKEQVLAIVSNFIKP